MVVGRRPGEATHRSIATAVAAITCVWCTSRGCRAPPRRSSASQRCERISSQQCIPSGAPRLIITLRRQHTYPCSANAFVLIFVTWCKLCRRPRPPLCGGMFQRCEPICNTNCYLGRFSFQECCCHWGFCESRGRPPPQAVKCSVRTFARQRGPTTCLDRANEFVAITDTWCKCGAIPPSALRRSTSEQDARIWCYNLCLVQVTCLGSLTQRL